MKIRDKSKYVILISTLLGLFALIPLLFSFSDKKGEVPIFGIEFGILSGICCGIILIILSKVYPIIAAYPPLFIAFLLVYKPKIAPVMHNYNGLHSFSYTSETHLYFVVPGVIVIIVSFFYLLIKKEVDS